MTVCPVSPTEAAQSCLIGIAETSLLIAVVATLATLGFLLAFALPWAVFGKVP